MRINGMDRLIPRSRRESMGTGSILGIRAVGDASRLKPAVPPLRQARPDRALAVAMPGGSQSELGPTAAPGRSRPVGGDGALRLRRRADPVTARPTAS